MFAYILAGMKHGESSYREQCTFWPEKQQSLPTLVTEGKKMKLAMPVVNGSLVCEPGAAPVAPPVPINHLGLEIRARLFEPAGTRPIIRNVLSHEEQEQLLQSATFVEYAHGGHTLFSEGQEADFLYFIDAGMIRISRCAENGRRQVLAFRVPGDIVGLFEDGRYTNSAETVGAAKLYRIPWQRMQQAMRNEPELQLHLFIKLADDYCQAEHRIMTLGQQNSCQRLASFLLELMQMPGLFNERLSILQLPVNRFDLADYLGMVTKSFERSFTTLESRGLIRRVTSRTIQIADIGGLQRLCQEQPRSRH
jgi:CRP-like cAMP-binding protein